MIALYEVLNSVLDSVIFSSHFLSVMHHLFAGCRTVEVILDMAACPVPSSVVTGLLLLSHEVSVISTNKLDKTCFFEVLMSR